ncbi:MAG: S53 family peptidase [Acidimicrobiales bacterium]
MQTRRLTIALAGGLIAVTIGMGSAPAGATPKEPSAKEVEARTNHHSHDVCQGKKSGFASCMSKVIDRGAADPTPLASTAPYGTSPAAIKAAYGFTTSTTAGAGQTIAVIGAYDDPTAQNDLAVFSATYGLPCNACLTRVNQTGGTSFPAYNEQWALEASLDVQLAHAIAPGAKILLVEATTNNWSDLMAAVDYAKTRAGYVTMSFGGPEFSSQTQFDGHFVAPGVSFFASSGDSGLPANYPSSSPNVVSVGGTTLYGLGTSNVTEGAWSSGGGGCSAYENATAAQKAFSQYGQAGCTTTTTTTTGATRKRSGTTTTTTVARRATPDVSLDADPMSGVSVYVSSNPAAAGWVKVGGTSASAPMFAARSAVDGGVMDSARIYGSNAPALRDVTFGNNGAPALTGYDMASGRGSWYDGTSAPAGSPPPPPPPPSGITNGGLETGNLSGWTASGASAALSSYPMGGTYAAQLGTPMASISDSTIAQTFTAAAATTTVSLWYRPNCAYAGDWFTATLRDNATGAVTTVVPATCAAGTYRQATSPLTAGGSYTLSITNHDDMVTGQANITQVDTVTAY